jgi:AcrR family transcriptional regulator
MRMRYKAGLETRDRILESTRAQIAELGLEGTTIKTICDAAGVLPGSFYNLFDSKEQAILTAVRVAIDAVDPDPEHSGTDTLDDLVNAYVRFVNEQDDLARVYIRIAVAAGRANPELKGRVLRHHEGRVKRFSDALQRERPDLTVEEADNRAEALVSALNGVTLHRTIDAEFDVAHFAHILKRVATA